MAEKHLSRRAVILGTAAALSAGAAASAYPPPADPPAGAEPDFKPFNRLPAGWNLAQTKAFLTAEGFDFDEEPKDGNGWLQANKFIGGDNTHHYVRIEFKAGY